MTELVRTARLVKAQINPRLTIGGVFLTMTSNTVFRRDIADLVRSTYGKQLPVMDTVIPLTVRLAEVSTADKSIFRHDPKGKAAEAYKNLVKEVLKNAEKQHKRAAVRA